MEDYIRKIFDGEAPCDKCPQANDCKEHEWACRAFSYYIHHGSFKDHTVRMPTRQLFDLIFKEDDIALKNYLKRIAGKESQSKLFE